MKDHDGYAPLHRVIENDHEEYVPLLLAAGANVNEVTNDGKTPLLITSMHQRDTTREFIEGPESTLLSKDDSFWESMEVLISPGADVNIKDYSGNAPQSNRVRP